MRNATQGERVEIMASLVGVGGAGEEGDEFLMDGGGQPITLKRLHEPHADDALILTGHNPQRIRIGTGTNTHGLHLLCYGIAEIEMPCVGYARGMGMCLVLFIVIELYVFYCLSDDLRQLLQGIFGESTLHQQV